MTQHAPRTSKPPTQAEQRQKRLAAELRANLAKRKQQSRARTAQTVARGGADDAK